MKTYLIAFVFFFTGLKSHTLYAGSIASGSFIYTRHYNMAADTSTPMPSFTRTDAYFQDLLAHGPQTLKPFIDAADSLRIQIIYTRIDRDKANNPSFTRYYFHVNPSAYFYPASTVKMPVALLALQKLNELKVFGLDEKSTMITEGTESGRAAVYNDPSSEDGRPTISGYIKKIFLVSDNDAFNQLYDFLGQQYINDRLHAMGYSSADIFHRLSVVLTEAQNRRTNPVAFFNASGKPLYSQPLQESRINYSERNDSIGKGYYSGGKLQQRAMDFSKKNRILLDDLTNILQSIIFPQSVPQERRFNIRPDLYPFLWKYMSQYPTETAFPRLDSSMLVDAYVKFLLHGATQEALPKTLRLFNKVGDAYGFLTDVAYVADFENKVEFMLSATIYCNTDGVLNDDKYDYATIGLPFMKELGRYIYEVEVGRKRTQVPDLSAFKFTYDR